MKVHWKIRFLGKCLENQYIGGELPKRADWIVSTFKEGLCLKEGVVWDLNAQYELEEPSYW